MGCERVEGGRRIRGMGRMSLVVSQYLSAGGQMKRLTSLLILEGLSDLWRPWDLQVSQDVPVKGRKLGGPDIPDSSSLLSRMISNGTPYTFLTLRAARQCSSSASSFNRRCSPSSAFAVPAKEDRRGVTARELGGLSFPSPFPSDSKCGATPLFDGWNRTRSSE